MIHKHFRLAASSFSVFQDSIDIYDLILLNNSLDVSKYCFDKL